MKRPIAYHITFTTYGTWLHGDNRGSVDKDNNQYGSDFVKPNLVLIKKEQCALKNPPVTLSQSQRRIALKAILDVCRFESWCAYAVHVRSNHIHIVVNGDEKPEDMLVKFKRYTTIALRNIEGKSAIKKYWTKHGSTRYLWTKESLCSAIRYVKNEQGKPLEFGRTEPRM